MYLIEESIEVLKKFFQNEWNVKEIEEALSDYKYSDSVSSTWKEYEECCSISSSMVQYEIKNPIELKEELQKMWKNDEDLNKEELINWFVVSAYRQTVTKTGHFKEEMKKTDINIPSYIYNF